MTLPSYTAPAAAPTYPSFSGQRLVERGDATLCESCCVGLHRFSGSGTPGCHCFRSSCVCGLAERLSQMSALWDDETLGAAEA